MGIYTFIHKIKQVMGLIDKIKEQKSIPAGGGDVFNEDINQLAKHEIEFLLHLIKQSNFRGDQLEILYNIVLKLQNQYIAH